MHESREIKQEMLLEMQEKPCKRAYTMSDAAMSQRRGVAHRKRAASNLPDLCNQLHMCADEQARLDFTIHLVSSVFSLQDLIESPYFEAQYQKMKKSSETKNVIELKQRLKEAEDQIEKLRDLLKIEIDGDDVLSVLSSDKKLPAGLDTCTVVVIFKERELHALTSVIITLNVNIQDLAVRILAPTSMHLRDSPVVPSQFPAELPNDRHARAHLDGVLRLHAGRLLRGLGRRCALHSILRLVPWQVLFVHQFPHDPSLRLHVCDGGRALRNVHNAFGIHREQFPFLEELAEQDIAVLDPVSVV